MWIEKLFTGGVCNVDCEKCSLCEMVKGWFVSGFEGRGLSPIWGLFEATLRRPLTAALVIDCVFVRHCGNCQ